MKKKSSSLDQRLSEIPAAERQWHRTMDDIAARIMDLMSREGLTQDALAARMDKHKSYINRVLGGGVNLTLKTIAEFEAALGASLIEVSSSSDDSEPRRRRREGQAGKSTLQKTPGSAAAEQAIALPKRLWRLLSEQAASESTTPDALMVMYLTHWLSTKGGLIAHTDSRKWPSHRAIYYHGERLVEFFTGGSVSPASLTIDEGPQDPLLRQLQGFSYTEEQ